VPARQEAKGSPLFTCQTAKAQLPCYDPQQIRTAYGVPSALTGAGETIVIIDAFGSPSIGNDLALFDATFGLPSPTLNVINPFGAVFDPTNPNQVGWSAEISLDVEWSHAIAPGATIDLVLSKTDADADILAAQQYAIDNNLGDVLSQSFGEAESCNAFVPQTHALFQVAQSTHMTVFASSGDFGAAQPTCDNTGYLLSASIPASDPLVTGVGGTHLNANFKSGAYRNETAWNNSGQPSSLDFGATGGGFSTVYPEPSYQDRAQTSGARGVPDVAYNGDLFGGVLVAWSESGQGANLFFIIGGTSAGSPQWSGITALADQAAGHRLGFLNPALYAIANNPPLYNRAFHDIKQGNNSWDVSGVTGYSASKGWDPVTGLGTPDVANLVSLLVGG
jgi:subtilase family serine protease